VARDERQHDETKASISSDDGDAGRAARRLLAAVLGTQQLTPIVVLAILIVPVLFLLLAHLPAPRSFPHVLVLIPTYPTQRVAAVVSVSGR